MGCHTAVFRELGRTITKFSVFSSIKKELLRAYPFESGGLVYKTGEIRVFHSLQNNCLSYYPSNEFFVSIIKDKPLFCFHSHLHLPKPSNEDLFFLKSYELPLIIYSLNYDCFSSVNIRGEEDYLTWFV